MEELLNRRPGHLLRRAHQMATAIFTSHAEEVGLTALQYLALVVINHEPGIDQSGVGRAAFMDRTNVSDVVRRLEKNGLLDRGQVRRKTSLKLTEAGRDVLERMAARTDLIDEAILGRLNASERAELTRLLKKLVSDDNG